MMAKRITTRLALAMAIVSFAVGAIPASGLVLKEDTVGRAIFAGVWIVLGLVWLGRVIWARKPGSE
jgi:hypothetical protein